MTEKQIKKKLTKAKSKVKKLEKQLAEFKTIGYRQMPKK